MQGGPKADKCPFRLLVLLGAKGQGQGRTAWISSGSDHRAWSEYSCGEARPEVSRISKDVELPSFKRKAKRPDLPRQKLKWTGLKCTGSFLTTARILLRFLRGYLRWTPSSKNTIACPCWRLVGNKGTSSR